ncbi:MAG: hypothetical protein IPK63_16515 [Candidatus Competibacteraceae bacterium]|nr:hypothetical protein [Candidatus Competibacteraceae bacterium]
MANTDNVFFSEERTPFIGEDSEMHVNHFIWAYNVDTQKLSQILTVTAGAEHRLASAASERSCLHHGQLPSFGRLQSAPPAPIPKTQLTDDR